MMDWDTEASRGVSQDCAGSGGRNLLSPTGGAAYGISKV